MIIKRITCLVLLSLVVKLSLAQTPTHYGPLYNGCKLAKGDTQHFYLVNEHDVVILPIDSISIEPDKVIQQIASSDIADRALIVAVLKMHTDPKSKIKELMALTENNDTIALFMLKNMDENLAKQFSKNKLRKLKSRKK